MPLTTTRKDPIVDDSIVLSCGRKLAYCEHGIKGSEGGEPVIFLCGAGMGRRYIPTPFPDLLETHNVRFITVDRPGYGNSSPHLDRTLQDWVQDIRELMDHCKLSRARFMAHSAGTPHLAAIFALAPELVIAASLVCPVSPIVGPYRPSETFGRGFLRLFLIHAGGLLDKLFGSVYRTWQDDPKSYVKDMQKMLSTRDNAFQNKYPGWLWEQMPQDFGNAVHEPNGVPAMIQDMFHVHKVEWGFRYQDIHTNNTKIEVWYGGADDTAPHGKWICQQLGVEGRLIDDAGHGLIHSDFEPILENLLRA